MERDPEELRELLLRVPEETSSIESQTKIIICPVPFEFGLMSVLRLKLLQFFGIHVEADEEFLKKRTGSRIILLLQG